MEKYGGSGASRWPSAAWRAASSSNEAIDPGASSIPAWASPRAANIAGTVRSVKSSGLAAKNSSHESGIETRASGVGRTEYALAVVRSRAFWL